MISTDTTVTMGLVITLLGAAFSFGIMWSRIQSLAKQVERIEHKVDEILENNHN